MRIQYCVWAFLTLAVLLVPAITACDSGSSGGNDEEDIPEGILYLAGDVFDTLSLVFRQGANPANGDYPAGMTVANGAAEGDYAITLANYSPEDSDAVVNGSAVIEITDTDPYRVSITGTINLADADYSQATLDADASWEAGELPATDNPASLTGTFVVDGSSYSVAAIMAAIEELEGDEQEPLEPPPVAPEDPDSPTPPPAEQTTALR